MTDEEKAEYLEFLFQKVCNNVDYCSKELDCTDCRIKVVKGIELGLAEGRKEKRIEIETKLYNDFIKISKKCASIKKENEELKKEISVLLSCSNCKENKGGYVCEKEYNDKCLSQKIEYIKELKEENAELKAQIEKMKCCGNCKHKKSKPTCFFCVKLRKWEKAE